MATREQNRWAEKIFTLLMCRAVDSRFRFPGGGLATQAVAGCLDKLDNGNGSLSREKVVDFCICQVYAIAYFDAEYMNRWKVSHSFGKKALERFCGNTSARRYYEDLWLGKIGLSRAELLDVIRDRSQHPLAKFIYPEYEDQTKARRTGSEAGLYLCSVSTLMWTPFSPVCVLCSLQARCREMTRTQYPELYRIRDEEFRKGGGQ